MIQRHLSTLEKDDDGGFAICGCAISGYCYIILLVMSAFFLIVGTVLTAITFRPMEKEEKEEPSLERKVMMSMQYQNVSKSTSDNHRCPAAFLKPGT